MSRSYQLAVGTDVSVSQRYRTILSVSRNGMCSRKLSLAISSASSSELPKGRQRAEKLSSQGHLDMSTDHLVKNVDQLICHSARIECLRRFLQLPPRTVAAGDRIPMTQY